MLRPDSSNRKISPEEKPAEKRPFLTVAPRNEVTEVAKTLAAYGGGAVAYDLALDLILNEVVEKARRATGATGAAIALTRDGEMECRATTGAVAPDLGVRLETESGLSGACLRTGEIQHCEDTETDERVDADACRQLGVRSMLVMPLADGKGAFGILEVLSAESNAFGDRDIEVLRSLARRIVASKREAEAGPAVALDVRMPAAVQMRDDPRDSEVRLASAADVFAETETRRASDIWTTVLVVLVIAAAVALGLMIGWRGAAKRWMSESRVRQSVAPLASVSQVALAPQPEASPPARLAVPLKTTSSAAAVVNRGEGQASGDLVVTQNGKVIYRLPPSAPKGTTAVPAKSAASESSSNRLVHQVEPEYPKDAKARRIQGPVVLEVQVLSDGSVGNIGIVEGNPLLADAAVRAVRQWRYQPNLVDGHPVESQTRIRINFTLPRAK